MDDEQKAFMIFIAIVLLGIAGIAAMCMGLDIYKTNLLIAAAERGKVTLNINVSK